MKSAGGLGVSSSGAVLAQAEDKKASKITKGARVTMGSKSKKYVYFFGGGKADGNESMKNLLGGKGANLAEMAGHPKLRLPVPPGFTLTTEVCTYYYQHKRTYPAKLDKEVQDAVKRIEKLMG